MSAVPDTVSQTRGIVIEGMRKRYGEGDTAVDALKDVNMNVSPLSVAQTAVRP